MAVEDFKKVVADKFAASSAQPFSFILTPESYLLAAGLLSGLVALPFLVLNVYAIQCLVTSCAALQDDSNTLQSWLVFEGITAFFVVTSVIAIGAYVKIRREQSGR
jgi:ethanolamine transporter EutH